LLPELIALDDYRLAHNWSWFDLALDMEKIGVQMSPRTLHYLCRRAHRDAMIRDLTLNKIRTFLKRKKIRVPAKAKAQRPAVKVALHV